MRHARVALFLALGGLAASCGRSQISLPDLAGANLDCLQVGGCTSQCVFTSGGDIASCLRQCQADARPGSAQKWADAFACAQASCTPPDRTGPCVERAGPTPADPTLLCSPGMPYAECQQATTATDGTCIACIANARNPIFANFALEPPGLPTGMCPAPDRPDCNGGPRCATLFAACLHDL